MHLESLCTVYITYCFLLHLLAHISHHQGKPNTRENMHRTQVYNLTTVGKLTCVL